MPQVCVWLQSFFDTVDHAQLRGFLDQRVRDGVLRRVMHKWLKAGVDGRDRDRVERLCRYVARPPVAGERLHLEPDGRVRYDLKKAWKDGTHAVVLDPLDLLSRLAALVPPPRFHMTRYHGVLAAHAKARPEVVRSARPRPKRQLGLLPGADGEGCPRRPDRPSRHPWAWLLRRVFAADVETCPRCEGRMRLVEVATDRGDIDRVLGAHVGLRTAGDIGRCLP